MTIENIINQFVTDIKGAAITLNCLSFNNLLKLLKGSIGQEYGDLASRYLCHEPLHDFNKASDGQRERLLMEYVSAEENHGSSTGGAL